VNGGDELSNLCNIRLNKNLTQEYMANSLKIAVSTYNQYENAVRNIPVSIVNQISTILGVKVEDIFLPIKFTVSK